MACFRPWKFQKLPGLYITLPCGKCIGCKKTRQTSWAIRCMHEAQMHKEKCFITLTLANTQASLDHTQFQKFIRAVRKAKNKKIRYFMCGEYGTQKNRPHYHAILYGVTFAERYAIGKNRYASKELERFWPHGYNTIGEVTHASAMYVAKYTCKSITGPAKNDYYKRVDLTSGEIIEVQPEYGRMSLKPGIGATWHAKYWREVHLARDGVTLPGGKVLPTPRYYNQLLELQQPALHLKRKNERTNRAASWAKDRTPARLKTRETCALAEHQRKKQTL